MKAALSGLLRSVAPGLAAAIASARSRSHAHRLFRTWGCDALAEELIARFGTSVLDGPFAGMTLTPRTHAEHLAPYLLGVYESELDDAWAVLLNGRYAQIIDVGAKFGYYAIGLARRYRETAVIAFDTDWWARSALREMIAANGTRNVAVRSLCSSAWLDRNLAEDALIVSDCEGYENELLGRAETRALTSAALLVETHDQAHPGVTDRLRSRFEATHTVRAIQSSDERRISARDLSFLPEERRVTANHEIRLAQQWLLCLPHRGANARLAAS